MCFMERCWIINADTVELFLNEGQKTSGLVNCSTAHWSDHSGIETLFDNVWPFKSASYGNVVHTNLLGNAIEFVGWNRLTFAPFFSEIYPLIRSPVHSFIHSLTRSFIAHFRFLINLFILIL